MITRRRFCLTAGAATTLALPAFARRAAATAADDTLTVTTLYPNAWMVAGEGGNSLVLATSDGPILVDAKVGPAGPELLDTVKRIAGSPPALVINTHHHGDHTGGNWIFSGDADVVAHRNVRPRLEATIDGKIRPALVERAKTLAARGNMALAQALERRAEGLRVESFAADREIEDSFELSFGGFDLVLLHVEPAHTDNDVAVFVKGLNVLHAGDLLFHELHPFIDRTANASTRGWQRSILATAKLCNDFTKVVPGHGTLTTVTGLVMQHFYFQRLRQIVGDAMDEGKTREQITAMKPTEFADLGFDGLRARTFGAMHDEIAEAGAP